ncbi:MAG: substrate-binding domain-containing protein [Flexilinea sp.]
MKKLVTVLLVGAILFAFAAFGFASEAEAAGANAEATGLMVAMSNSFAGNAWRAQTIKIFDAYAQQLKEKGIISKYYASSAGDDAQNQINEIRNMISQGYDIILVNSASESALRPVLEEATEQGIIVVSFDNKVTGEGLYTVGIDEVAYATRQAEWLVEQLGGKGNIYVIRGLAGSYNDGVRYECWRKVLDQYPDINIIAEGYGGWDAGTTSQLMNDFLAAHPDVQVDGILQQGHGEVSMTDALVQHNIDPGTVAMTGEYTNGFFRVILEYGINAFIEGVPCYLPAAALDVALKLANGEAVEADTLIDPPVIDSADAEKWYQADLPDTFMNGWTDVDNTYNLTLADVVSDQE